MVMAGTIRPPWLRHLNSGKKEIIFVYLVIKIDDVDFLVILTIVKKFNPYHFGTFWRYCEYLFFCFATFLHDMIFFVLNPPIETYLIIAENIIRHGFGVWPKIQFYLHFVLKHLFMQFIMSICYRKTTSISRQFDKLQVVVSDTKWLAK